MKITKISQVASPTPSPVPQPVQSTPSAGEVLTDAIDPQIKTVFMQAIQGTGLNKQKVLPFLEQLFMAFGDLPISKVTGVIKALNVEETPQAQPLSQAVPQAAPQAAPQAVPQVAPQPQVQPTA